MAEIIGFLRDDSASFGEKLVLKLLKQNLPKEFTVFVETPIHKKREIRYPDFIVLTNYGVIILEVKDWAFIDHADPHGCIVRTRNNETRREKNPVNTAREYALILSTELNSKRNDGEPGEAIPWSYAAVLPNISSVGITQLRRPWGEEFIFGKSDLEIPDLLLSRIKNTFPVRRMRPLSKVELDLIRATIYPIAEIEADNRPTFVLDEQQVRIVSESIHQEIPTVERSTKPEKGPSQERLFERIEQTPQDEEEMLSKEGKKISQNTSVRLVRGFSGSGKTLVLVQRAKFLAAQFPEWKIAVLTYNKALQTQLSKYFKTSTIKPMTFHSLCRHKIQIDERSCSDLKHWLAEQTDTYKAISTIGIDVIFNEINWLREMGILELDAYLKQQRKGIGKDVRLGGEQRREIFQVLEAYRAYLKAQNRWDWEELPLTFWERCKVSVSPSDQYDAILIDEAQDWAPVWFRAINILLKPETGYLFLADDPSQSIFRSFSWREKGINVLGRTRWLRVPYRSTYEIFQAAYSMIADHKEIQAALAEEGELIEPQVSSDEMRHGLRPLIRRFSGSDAEVEYLKNEVASLISEGYQKDQITVLAGYKKDEEAFKKVLKGSDITVNQIKGFKGLEMEAVIIPHLQKNFYRVEDEINDRRLLYMAMSRARSRLIMTYSGRLPACFELLREQNLADFVI